MKSVVSKTLFKSYMAKSLVMSCLLLVLPFTVLADEPFDRETLKIRDRLVLKSGHLVAGVFVKEEKTDGRTFITFKTDDGLFLKLDKARQVSRVYELDPKDLEYNEMIDSMNDTSDDHYRLFNWCEDQKSGTVRYKAQIKFHLERIMELDPNDDKVRKKLNYEFLKSQGRWVPSRLYRERSGYVRRGSGWMSTLQADVDGFLENNRSLEGGIRKAFDIWKNKLAKAIRKNDSTAELLQELRQLCNADTIPLIFDEAIEESNDALRAEYVEAIGAVQAYGAMEALVHFAINDTNSNLRDRALTLVQNKDFYSPHEASERFSQYLTKKSNVVVQRAAFAMGELNSDTAILPLIDALVTRHQIAPGQDPNRMQTGFSNNGIQSFQMGGDSKPKIMDIKNMQVSKALKKITGEELGFDSQVWRNWYIENHTLNNVSLRDDE